ncbi:MAG TPA: response regulator transcription factor [Flavobacteriales bacterium]
MQATTKSILLVEDDPRLSRSLSDQLQQEGFEVVPQFDGDMALRAIRQRTFDLVLLDLGLPHVNGFGICSAIRQRSGNTPIIILTAFSDIDSKTNAFDLGADDYLVKPVHFKELLAKVRVFLKRSESHPLPLEVLRIADLSIDIPARQAIRGGRAIELSPREFNLLMHLARNQGRVLSKDDLAREVWEDSHTVSPNTIEVYISFLRGKVDKGFDTKLIHTRHGFGYTLNEAEP